MTKDIEIKLRNIIKQVCEESTDIDKIDLNDSLSLIDGINSISFIKIIVAVETEFGIEFDDEHLNLNRLSNLESIINYIKMRLDE